MSEHLPRGVGGAPARSPVEAVSERVLAGRIAGQTLTAAAPPLEGMGDTTELVPDRDALAAAFNEPGNESLRILVRGNAACCAPWPRGAPTALPASLPPGLLA